VKKKNKFSTCLFNFSKKSLKNFQTILLSHRSIPFNPSFIMKKLLIFAFMPLFLFGCEALETDTSENSDAQNNQRISPNTNTEAPVENPFADLPSLRELIEDNNDVSVFLEALAALNAQNILDAENQQITLFLPTNEAFDQIPETIRTDLFKEENKRALDTLIAYHIAQGRGNLADFADGAIIRSLLADNGILINIEEDGGYLINKGARIVGDAMEGSNGVIFMIDSVLIPQNFLQAPEETPAETEATPDTETMTDETDTMTDPEATEENMEADETAAENTPAEDAQTEEMPIEENQTPETETEQTPADETANETEEVILVPIPEADEENMNTEAETTPAEDSPTEETQDSETGTDTTNEEKPTE
jgi:uncharacterized surface protein with fasciclin (FAS1) repeats